MIQARKLGHVVLKVRDARTSKEFYTRTQHHDLALFQVATGDAAAATTPGLHHTAWQLGSFAELQAAHDELQAMGIAVESTIAHNVTRSVYFHDPDGNRVELYCDMFDGGFAEMQALGPRRDQMDIATGEVLGR
jgi:catechol-2,3-dioxygenase